MRLWRMPLSHNVEVQRAVTDTANIRFEQSVYVPHETPWPDYILHWIDFWSLPILVIELAVVLLLLIMILVQQRRVK